MILSAKDEAKIIWKLVSTQSVFNGGVLTAAKRKFTFYFPKFSF